MQKITASSQRYFHRLAQGCKLGYDEQGEAELDGLIGNITHASDDTDKSELVERLNISTEGAVHSLETLIDSGAL